MSDLIKQLGLDFLRGQQREAPEPLPPFLKDALLSYSRPILEALARAHPGTIRLYALIDQLQIPIEVALKVVDYLERNNLLTIVRRDLKGDHELQLTDAGRRLLG